MIFVSACFTEQVPPPGETVEAFFAHIQAEEYFEANQLFLNESTTFLYEVGMEYSGIFQNLSYENILEYVDDDRAYVRLSISTVDFAKVMESVISDAFFWVFREISVDELYELIKDTLIDRIAADDVTMTENEVLMKLELVNGEWRILPEDELLDGLSGGVLSFREYVLGWE